MALNYNVQPARLGQAFGAGQAQYHQTQAMREQTANAPLRRRMQELGVQRAEQEVRAGELDFKNQNIQKYIGDAYEIMSASDTGQGFDYDTMASLASSKANEYLSNDDPMDDEAGRNLQQLIQMGPEAVAQAMNGIVQRGMAEGVLQIPRQTSQQQEPTAIAEAKFAYPDDPVKQREYVARRSRGGARTPEEDAAAERLKAREAEIGEAEGQAAAAEIEGSDAWAKKMKANRDAAEAEQKAMDAAKASETKERFAQRYSRIVAENIDDAIAIVEADPFWTTGFVGGQVLANLGGTQAANLRATLDTIEAGVAFDRLQAMRDSSPTGGALGQVSEMEITLLKSALGSVKQAQSADQLKRRLERMKEIYNEIVHGQPNVPQDRAAPSGEIKFLGFE